MAKRSKYDWEAWFGQPITVLSRGVDYQLSQSMMYQTIKNNAHQRGVRVRVRDHGTYMVIEVMNRDVQLHTDRSKAAVTPQRPAALEGAREGQE